MTAQDVSTPTTQTLTVVQALSAVMAEVKAIGKGSRNEQQGYDFRGIDQVMSSLHGPLTRYGVMFLPQVEERLAETRQTKGGGTMNVVHLRVRYTFYGPAGDSVAAVVWGEAQDSADKATNKALSAALKYALLQVLCVPTQDMGDADSTTVESAPARRVERSKGRAGDEDQWSATPVELRTAIAQEGQRLGMTPDQIRDDYAARHAGEHIGDVVATVELSAYLHHLAQTQPAQEEVAS